MGAHGTASEINSIINTGILDLDESIPFEAIDFNLDFLDEQNSNINDVTHSLPRQNYYPSTISDPSQIYPNQDYSPISE